MKSRIFGLLNIITYLFVATIYSFAQPPSELFQGGAYKQNAIKAVGYAVKNGYGSKHQIENDPAFDLIRSDKFFKKLLATVK